MRCPICGAKLYQKQICPYCKVTDEQITSASNKKVKEYRKTGRKDLIHFSNVIPSDISKPVLWTLTILLGWLGINHYYIKRNIRGTYSMVSTIGSLTILIILMFANISTTFGKQFLGLMYDLLFFMMAINTILWIFDIINLICRTFKVPVVLAKKGEKNV